MKLNLSGNFEARRQAALAEIDRRAEAARLAQITDGAGQSMTYTRKLSEALDLESGGIGPWPHLAGEVGVTGADETAVAAVIIAQNNAWVTASAAIEGRRMAAKKQAREAETQAELDAARAVDFSTIQETGNGDDE
ncbi:hypothetical protein E1297_01045 [Roseibium sp. RKSG952]|nr:hypothetical protein [Roseibium sp. RKSG952]